MIRIFLLRILIGTWLIPILYIIGLPLLYLFSGEFKRELSLVNEICSGIWSGNLLD